MSIRHRFPSDLTSSFVADIRKELGDGFKDRYLDESILSKFNDPDPSSAKLRADRAVAKWLAIEERNQNTNFRLYTHDPEKVIAGLEFGWILATARSIIRRLIGVTVPMDRFIGSFSGGASTSQRKTPGAVARKYSDRPDITHEAWDTIWPWLYRDADLWLKMNPEVLKPRFVDSNIMFTVPKNSDIDRVACKEPDLNMLLQKGVGDFIRSRLRNVQIDLNDQSINQKLAREGSVTGKLATVDLSSASDSITTQLVCELLSPDWFTFLNSIRCRTTRLPDGTQHENEMFSSMGNGFTFELESLIFYAITKAVDKGLRVFGRVSVYGDDIILDSRLYGALKQVFHFVGFKTNDKKSFARGQFRESCGGHYLSGVDVTPFYIKRPITEVPHLIHALNSLRRWARFSDTWCDAGWYSVWLKYAEHVPVELHGGYDLSSIETLASPDGAAKRLMKVTKRSRPKDLEVGLYLEWQANARTRVRPSEREQTVTFERASYRVVKARKHFAFNFGLRAPAFPQEFSEA